MRSYLAGEMRSRGTANLTASQGAESPPIEDSTPPTRKSARIAAVQAKRRVASDSPVEDTESAAETSAERSLKHRGNHAADQPLSKRRRQPSSAATSPDRPSIEIAGGPSQAKPAAATPVEKDPFPIDDGWEALHILAQLSAERAARHEG